MSNSVRPHRRQATRLPHPWDSPGKNTGVGCHFLLEGMKVKSEMKSLSRVQLLATPWTAAHQAPLSMGLSRQEYWSGLPLPFPWKVLCKINMLYWLKSRFVAVEFQTLIFPSGISVIKANSCWIFRKFIAIELKSHSVKLTIAFCFLLASFFLGLPTLSPVQASLHIHDVHPSVQFSHSVMSDSLPPHE